MAGEVRRQATTEAQDREALGRLADEVLPALVARLGSSGLGELEVRGGDWHVRLRREPSTGSVGASGATAAGSAALRGPHGSADGSPGMVRSPAVGYFVPRRDLAVGLPVRTGDAIGHVEVLGLRQDVPVALDGIVGRVYVQPGQAVEYGQELLRVDTIAPPDATEDGAGAAAVAD